MLAALKQAACELQRRPKASDMMPGKGRPSYKAYHRLGIGGLAPALVSIGMAPDRVRRVPLSKERAAMRRMAAALGRTPSQTDVNLLRKEPRTVLGRDATFEELCLISHLPAPSTIERRHRLSWTEFALRCGLPPNERFYGVFWRKWERLCKEIAEAIYGPSARASGTRLPSGGVPDIIVEANDEIVFVDAKLSGYIGESHIPAQIREYRRFCDRLEFWCLARGHEYRGVEYVYPEVILERLQTCSRPSRPLVAQLLKFQEQRDRIGGLGYWTKDAAIKGLRQFAEEIGRTPTIEDCRHPPSYLPSRTTLAGFGPFPELLAAAGLVPHTFTHLGDDELVRLLRTWARRNPGKIPISRDFGGDNQLPNVKLYEDRFGSLEAALARAGFRDLVARWLQEEARRLGRAPSKQEWSRRRFASVGVSRLFKSAVGFEARTGWGRALEYARIVETYRGLVLDELQWHVDRTGDLPSFESFRGRSVTSEDARDEYGVWRAALRAFLSERCGAQSSTAQAGAALREHRLRLGMTQAAVAKLIGAVQGNYSGYETGRQGLSYRAALTIAEGLAIPIAEILGPGSAK